MAKDTLTIRMENFAQAVVKLGSYTDAYKEAYNAKNMKQTTINRTAWEIAQIPKVAERIAQLQKSAEKQIIYGVAEAMRDAVDLHLADANELIQLRHLNCRHCYGKDHAYQWKDPREFANATAAWIQRETFEKSRRGPKTMMPPRPEDIGGYGFVKVRDPNPTCPKCDGEGVEDIKVTDTRKLTGRAKKLYAGVKVAKDGRIEVLTRNQDLALTNVMKALGMFADTVKVLPPGAPADGVPALPDDPAEASRVYQAWLKGEK